MDETFTQVTRLVVLAIWGTGEAEVNAAVFEEMQRHAIAALPADVLPQLELPKELSDSWRRVILGQLTQANHCRQLQSGLALSVPYVILKGTEAAKYYPVPEYRTLGDIDLMTRPEDEDTACRDLLGSGWHEVTDEEDNLSGRHRRFARDGFSVEVHTRFAHRSDPEKAAFLDSLILRDIGPSHQLSDPVNGLVLIDHIAHHLEHGLGLRQIIDWMMYVDRCLPDEQWPAFQPLARQAGLERLAIVTARLCELHLGLKEHRWCAGADPALCDALLRYVMACGNFGRSQADDTRVSERLLSRNPREAFRFLQSRGQLTWEAARQHPSLRSFAWLYQLCRYLRKGLTRQNPLRRLREEYEAGRERKALLDKLGVGLEKKAADPAGKR